MITLAANQKLRAKLGEAKTTTDCSYTSTSWKVPSGSRLTCECVPKCGNLNGTTEVDVVDLYADGIKQIDSLIIDNRDTVSHTVILEKYTASVDWTSAAVTLDVGSRLLVNKEGELIVTSSGIVTAANGPLFVSTASATVANTTSETSIIGTGVGTLTLPANTLSVGRQVHMHLFGYLGTTGTPTLRIRWKAGSTVLADTTAQTLSASISGNEWFEAFLDLTCRSVGVTGTVIGQGMFRYHLGAGAAGTDMLEALNTSPVTLDTTATQALDVTAQWGTANASNTITGTNASIDLS